MHDVYVVGCVRLLYFLLVHFSSFVIFVYFPISDSLESIEIKLSATPAQCYSRVVCILQDDANNRYRDVTEIKL